jgi:hypothetical protein
MQIVAYKYYFLALLFAFFSLTSNGQQTHLSNQQKAALAYLDSHANISQSNYWHNVNPSLF